MIDNTNTHICNEVTQVNIYYETDIQNIQTYNYNFRGITYYSDFVRVLLLYNYGGCWFDLDCFILYLFTFQTPIIYNTNYK